MQFLFINHKWKYLNIRFLYLIKSFKNPVVLLSGLLINYLVPVRIRKVIERNRKKKLAFDLKWMKMKWTGDHFYVQGSCTKYKWRLTELRSTIKWNGLNTVSSNPELAFHLFLSFIVTHFLSYSFHFINLPSFLYLTSGKGVCLSNADF